MTKKQIQMMVLVQDLVLAFVINSTATILGGGFKETGLYLVGMFEAFSINYIAGLIIPVERIGRAVAGGIGLKDGSFAHKLVRIFIINAIFVTIISFTIALINCGPVPNIVSIWFGTYPILHLVGFVTSVLIEKPVADLVCTFVK
ncbi:MAG TPA: hypothetical protein DHV42_05035 [Lachnospiraceae bacterium]|jgi:hypothetical protein|nr:hypothetical protein [Lachnospiraceae bacterium]